MRRLLFATIGLLLLVFFSLKSALPTKAEVRPEAATVFTGQIIPAFIGGAYDPSEAFKQLAGLYVYVFAYDAFQGANQIKGNLAIRTQIRADGSFQAQGLFAGSHYGIYFPYKGVDTDSVPGYDTIVRTDCRTGVNQGQPHCPANGTYVGGNLVADGVYFRWPEAEIGRDDKILDVFSYKQNDTVALNGGNPIIVQDQIQCSNPPCSKGFEDVVMDRVFASSTTRLDIENSINVFPVIPISNVRINVWPEIIEEVGASYEVAAIRVSERIKTLIEYPEGSGKSKEVEYLRATNYPIIRGRTNPSQLVKITPNLSVASASFQAYAPPGYYALVAWRSEAGSLTYKDYEGASKLNSSSSAFGFLRAYKDWRELLTVSDLREESLVMAPNRIVVWGLVTKENGIIMTEENKDISQTPQPKDLKINIWSDAELEYSYMISKNEDFYRCGALQDYSKPPGVTWKGMYAFCQRRLSGPPINDRNDVFIDEDNYQRLPNNNKDRTEVYGTDGPQRVNLTAVYATNSTGYAKGIVLDVKDKDGKPVSDADVSLFVLSDDSKDQGLRAAATSYATNVLGRGYIPDTDLKQGISYLIQATSGGRIGFKAVENYDGYEDLISNPIKLSQAHSPPEPYKVLGLIPVPLSIIHAQGYQVTPIEGELLGAEEVQGLQVYVRRKLSAGPAETCYERQADGTVIRGGAGSNGSCKFEWTEENKAFTIDFQVPLGPKEIRTRAIAECDTQPAILQPLCLVQALRLPETGLIVSSYVLEIAGTKNGEDFKSEYRFTVGDKGFVSPPFVRSNFGLDCDKITGPSAGGIEVFGHRFGVPDIAGWLSTQVNQSSCNFALMVTNSAPGLIGDFQRYFLQVRPLTDAPGIVQAWNLMRALTNIFFIVFLILIGFATILRWDPKTWSLGLLLPRLLIAIVLANFSLLIVQLLLDVNNVLTHAIFNMAGQILAATKPVSGGTTIVSTATAAGVVTGLATALTTALAGALFSTITLAAGTGGLSLVPTLITLLGFVITILTFLLGLLILWFTRYAVIWIATVIAPLVFALGALPATENFRGLWVNTILPFTLMQTVTAVIFTIGLFLLTVSGGADSFMSGMMTMVISIFILAASIKAPQLTAGMFKGLVSSKALGAPGEALGKWKGEQAKTGFLSEKATEGRMKAISEARATGGLGFIRGVFRGGAYEREAGIREQIETGQKAAAAKQQSFESQQRLAYEEAAGGAIQSALGMTETKRKTYTNYAKNTPSAALHGVTDDAGNAIGDTKELRQKAQSINVGAARKQLGLAGFVKDAQVREAWMVSRMSEASNLSGATAADRNYQKIQNWQKAFKFDKTGTY